jgi:HSP20 family protein
MNFLTARSGNLNDFRTVQNRLFEPFFGRFQFMEDSLENGTWAPAVDVAEEAGKIVVRAEIAGVDEKDIQVHFEDGLLSIRGERQFERRDDRNYHRIERAYGSFVRNFSLPRTVDASAIQASYRNGILEIEIPKKEESKPRQIKVNVAGDKQTGEKQIEG